VLPQGNCAMPKLFIKDRQRHSLQVKVYPSFQALIRQGFGAPNILAHYVQCGV